MVNEAFKALMNACSNFIDGDGDLAKFNKARAVAFAASKLPVTIHVVMGNDFPEAVFDSLSAAKEFCIAKRKEGPFSRIYWLVCDLPLNNKRNASS